VRARVNKSTRATLTDYDFGSSCNNLPNAIGKLLVTIQKAIEKFLGKIEVHSVQTFSRTRIFLNAFVTSSFSSTMNSYLVSGIKNI
jgi:hypothetical protein